MYTNNLKYYFTKYQFLKHYCNFGSSKHTLDRTNSYYLIGLYYNISILNLKLHLYKFKKNINFLINISFKLKFQNPFIVNTTKNKFVQIYLKSVCLEKNISYFFGLWWGGFLKNIKKNLKIKNYRVNQLNLVHEKAPTFCLYLNDQAFNKNDQKSSINFYKEVNDISLFCIVSVNTEISTLKVPFVIYSNTKSNINNYFFNNLYITISKKMIYMVKRSFLLFLFKKWNVFKLNNFKRVYFEYLFCNRKNKIKSWILEDDLK